MSHLAIIGMAARVPGAQTPAEFWENLRAGIESISQFRPEELEIEGDREQWRDPAYVRARGILPGIDMFDAGLFGIYPQEAKLMDPQARVFLELCWEALEDAGYEPTRDPAVTGVFAGCSPNSYFLRQICSDASFARQYTEAYQVGFYPTMLGTIADTLATRVSYKLNLKGPSLTLLSACSTSLVAVAQAAKSLLLYECDLALAGGVSITLPQKRGYLYQAGGMVSPDGHCRTFDADAGGTVFGSGAGVVLLKRLADAEADGDHIYAVVRGAALNNDGAGKVGFTAPSTEGQARVIALAQAEAGVTPDQISYIEAHGTATPLGDPIEVAALTEVFRAQTDARQFCALGTAKTNVGHLDAAAGVVGLIKTALSLEHRELPAILHFEKPNPKLNLESSPFYVNAQLRPWTSSDGGPLRAGVSAFGVGGTNAHVVLEEAPASAASASRRSTQILPVSARSGRAAQQATERLADHLTASPSICLADVAYTLQVGRHHFANRRCAVAGTATEAAADLRRALTDQRSSQTAPRHGGVAFLFPGQGSQRVNMGRAIYDTEPVFQSAVDRCAAILEGLLPADLRQVLYPEAGGEELAQAHLSQTVFSQPAVFTISYALAELWKSWGVAPQAMLGHSVGEFVAACLAGVLSLEDCLELIARRGQLMQSLPGGAMLSVRLPADEVRRRLNGSAGPQLSIAAVNSPNQTVISGETEAVRSFEAALTAAGIASRALQTSHAFHSAMMDPITAEFTAEVARRRLRAPELPYVSSVTGDWARADEATDAQFWARHFREPVEFSRALAILRSRGDLLLLEVGPGQHLAALARQHTGADGQVILSSLAGAPRTEPRPPDEAASLHRALGAVWTAGIDVDWLAYAETGLHRVSLPTYPFERERFWAEPGSDRSVQEPAKAEAPAAPPNPSENTKSLMSQNESQHTSLVSRLVAMFAALSGYAAETLDPGRDFLDLGLDSLFLTQITQQISRELKVKVTFRQLLEDLNSIQALAAYLGPLLPPEAVPVPAVSVATAAALPPPAPSTPAATVLLPNAQPVSFPALNSQDSGAQGVIAQQIAAMTQLFSLQLQVLGSTSSAATPVLPALTATTALTAPSPQPPSVPAPISAISSDKGEFKPFGPYKPPQKGPTSGVTPEQRAYLDRLIERYTTKTRSSKEHVAAHRKVLADPRVASGFRSLWKEMVYPIVVERSRGTRLTDLDGNEYIDFLNGFGPIVFGHLPDFVADALTKQIARGMEIGPQTPLAGEVALLISKLTGVERVTFCNTGSEAVMAGLRVARTVTGRDRIALFAGSYHGTFDEVLVKRAGSVAGSPSNPIAPGIPLEKVQNVTVLDYGAPESLAWIRQNAGELAAVVVEPVQSRHPALQPREFLQELRQITAQSGTALLLDEVVTGFRVHPGGIQKLFGIEADLVTYGKVLGGGMPIGVLAGKASFMDALDGGAWQYGDDSFPEVGVTFFAGTFVRHPLALAAAKAVLEHIDAAGPELQRQLGEDTSVLVERLNHTFASVGLRGPVESFGSVFYFAMPSELRFGSLLYYHLREQGIHIQEGFPCFLTTAHTQADRDALVRAFSQSLQAMKAGGLIPAGLDDNRPKLTAVSQSALPEAPPAAPLTEAQLEVWLASQLSSEAACAFNEGFTVSLNGPLDVSALQRSLEIVVNRHEALRATFNDEGTAMRVAARLALEVPLRDLSDEPDREKAVRNIIAEDSRTPFDLERGPLVRVQLLRFAPADHLILFTSHHIVCDGWSTNVILNELGQCYTQLSEGRSFDLPAPMQFSTYRQILEEQKDSPDAAKTEQFWLDQFATLPAVLDLPTDRPRPVIRSFRGNSVRRVVAQSDYQFIKDGGAAERCTLFATLLAGFELLLCRLTNQDDVVVGIPTAGQSVRGNTSLVGHCVNFLPHRLRLPAETTFSGLLGQVRRTVLDAYDHQEYTYGTLVRKLAMPRDPSRLPLIEVQFNLERVALDLSFANLQSKVDSAPKSYVNFDLFLNILEADNGLVLDCDYNTDLFDEQTIERWLGHYLTLLKSGLANRQDAALATVMLTPAERDELVSGRNQTAADYPRELTPAALIEKAAASTPAAIAVVSQGHTLTYAELNGRANQLARLLQKFGVGRGEHVAICTGRSHNLVVALLGVLKSGGAYLPLDPTHPQERLQFILAETKVKVILTDDETAVQLSDTDARVLRLDGDWALVARESAEKLAPVAQPSDTAYLIYTSGSTGRPKGVAVSHQALTNFLWAMKHQPALHASDRLLAVTTVSFDIAGLELLGPLVAGGRVVVASDDATRDGYRLASLLESEKITVLQATPSTWRLLLEAGWLPTPAVRVFCGGEAFPRALADELLKGGGEVWNMYGPTETTIWSAVSRVTEGTSPVTVGPPIQNTQFYVVDTRLSLVPPGVAGELLIGGDSVAEGYFERPELTREKFVADPFGPKANGRLYRTGDLVKTLPDGSLEFLGRIDHQVKIRGFRIELGEIESALTKIEAVQEAVVTAHEESGIKRLVAYYVSSTGELDSAALRAALGRELPHYMIPVFFVALPALPKTPNGKVDRRALPTPTTASERKQTVVPRERSESEQRLSAICSEVLKLQEVHPEDNLFELGADSIHVFQIVARATRAGLSLSAQDILRHPTVAHMSQYLGAQAAGIDSGARAKPAGTIGRVNRDAYRVSGN